MRFVLRILFLVFVLQTLFSIAIAGEFRYDSHGKRDPFTLATKGSLSSFGEEGALSQLKLEGVVIDPKGKSIAIINGEVVNEGDRLGETIKVKRITNQGVELESEGKTFLVPIAPQE